jgi:formate--tetrahydrofolate ligase
LSAGLANLGRHIENLERFGPKVFVALNHFAGDPPEEHDLVIDWCRSVFGVEAFVCRHWAEGSAGAEPLARAVAAASAAPGAPLRLLYEDKAPLRAKVETIAREIYRASGVVFSKKAQRDLARFEADGFGALPVCVAKTPYSFSTDDALLGAPEGHVLPVTEARLSAGAGFVAVLCGEVLTMPGLPRTPSAESITLDDDGRIQGLF